MKKLIITLCLIGIATTAGATTSRQMCQGINWLSSDCQDLKQVKVEEVKEVNPQIIIVKTPFRTENSPEVTISGNFEETPSEYKVCKGENGYSKENCK